MRFLPARFGVFAFAICVFSAVAAPVEIVPAEFRGAIQPQVAVAPSGRIHVAFGKDDAVYHTASANGGRSFAKPVRVGALPKLALGRRRGPRLAATDQVVAITAISHAEGALHAWSSSDGGASWKAGAQINEAPKSAREGLHAMAGDGQGNVFATWLDLRGKGMELWSALSRDGGVTWGANALVYQSPDGHICECCHPSVAMDAQGRVAVLWRNWLDRSRDMYAALSLDRGRTFAPAQKLGAGTWKLHACPMDGGAIALAPDGKAFTAWRRETTTFAAEIAGPEERLADGAFQPIVVAAKDSAYFLWESGGGLMLKKGAASPVRFAEKAAFVAGAARPQGGAVIVWEAEVHGAKTLRAEILD